MDRMIAKSDCDSHSFAGELYSVGRQACPRVVMKFSEPLESQRLSFLLEKAASREAQMWKVYVPKIPTNQDTHISPAQRDEAVSWLIDLHLNIQLYPETISLAVGVLDRFLAIVKARPKYLRCIAITCFFLAAKTIEEDEVNTCKIVLRNLYAATVPLLVIEVLVFLTLMALTRLASDVHEDLKGLYPYEKRIPSLRDLAKTSSCGCSPSEILRMERIILDKLNWDLHMATPLDFLHIFHAMVLTCRSRFLTCLLGTNRSEHMALLTQQLYHCLADHTLLQVKGSMLALAIITLELEKWCPDWLALTIDLLKKAQIDSSQLIRCRELVARVLSPQLASLPPNTVYIYQPLRHSWQALVSRQPPGDRAAAFARDGSRPLGPLAPPAFPDHLHPQPFRLRGKHSTKRKVEEMEVDEFYDGIKRLYNEDPNTQEGTAGEGQSLACSSSLVRQEGSISPCPPLQPVSVT
ncbi:cyclin-I-like [Scleropages formosus]|uniref:Cyclin-I n=1 Tax=Scleropages formosus TaxID=113540 RepID=A0A0N8JYY0_SCLFO|nr:cyclin-I-like [Scleropages formosus]